MIEFAIKGKLIDKVIKNFDDEDTQNRTLESILSDTPSGREIISKHDISSEETMSEELAVPRKKKQILKAVAEQKSWTEPSHRGNRRNSCMDFCQVLSRLFNRNSPRPGPNR